MKNINKSLVIASTIGFYGRMWYKVVSIVVVLGSDAEGVAQYRSLGSWLVFILKGNCCHV